MPCRATPPRKWRQRNLRHGMIVVRCTLIRPRPRRRSQRQPAQVSTTVTRATPPYASAPPQSPVWQCVQCHAASCRRQGARFRPERRPQSARQERSSRPMAPTRFSPTIRTGSFRKSCTAPVLSSRPWPSTIARRSRRKDCLQVGDVIATPDVAQLEKSYPDLCPKASHREAIRQRATNVSSSSSYANRPALCDREGRHAVRHRPATSWARPRAGRKSTN